jgi:hypothetical protein
MKDYKDYMSSISADDALKNRIRAANIPSVRVRLAPVYALAACLLLIIGISAAVVFSLRDDDVFSSDSTGLTQTHTSFSNGTPAGTSYILFIDFLDLLKENDFEYEIETPGHSVIIKSAVTTVRLEFRNLRPPGYLGEEVSISSHLFIKDGVEIIASRMFDYNIARLVRDSFGATVAGCGSDGFLYWCDGCSTIQALEYIDRRVPGESYYAFLKLLDDMGYGYSVMTDEELKEHKNQSMRLGAHPYPINTIGGFRFFLYEFADAEAAKLNAAYIRTPSSISSPYTSSEFSPGSNWFIRDNVIVEFTQNVTDDNDPSGWLKKNGFINIHSSSHNNIFINPPEGQDPSGFGAHFALPVNAPHYFEVGGDSWNQLHVAGSAVTPPFVGVDPALIKAVRFTFHIPDFDVLFDGIMCANCRESAHGCVGVAVNSEPTGWRERFFCYAATNQYTIDFKYQTLDWLQVSAAIWIEGLNGVAAVELLDENGDVIAQ